MWKSNLDFDKYQYARTNPFNVRFMGFLGVVSTILMAIGFWKYLQLNILYLIIMGPIVLVFVLNKFLRFFLQLFYQKFDIHLHEQFIDNYWNNNKEPAVDIFLPWAGEDLKIHETVLQAVSQIEYINVNVYMLDDAGSDEHKNLAKKYNFIYLSRPNKGAHKKSGNLEYGYNNSNGEFILILDADFIPIKKILKDLIPYIATDPAIGILQTPQYFEQTNDVHNRSKIEFGGGNIVEDFYRIVMPCRDEFKAAMCVGTSAVYRKKAIEELKGTPKVHASEDLATGLLVTQFGYYVKYLPLIVSMGKSPDTYQGYFKQHLRWCSGNLVFAKYWPRARLNVVARLIYLINPMHYLSEALTVVFAFQFLALLYFHSYSLSVWNTVYFLPYIVLSKLITPFIKVNKSKIGTKLAALNNSYTYLYTYIRMLVKGIPTWHPTGVKIGGLHNDFIEAFNIGTFISASYIILFFFILLSKPFLFGNYNTYIVLVWCFYSVFWHAMFLTFVAEFIHPFKVATAQTYTKKMFLYVKKHIMLYLYFMLVGAAFVSFIVSLFDYKTPTRVAVNTLLSHYNEHAKVITPLSNDTE